MTQPAHDDLPVIRSAQVNVSRRLASSSTKAWEIVLALDPTPSETNKTRSNTVYVNVLRFDYFHAPDTAQTIRDILCKYRVSIGADLSFHFRKPKGLMNRAMGQRRIPKGVADQIEAIVKHEIAHRELGPPQALMKFRGISVP